MLNPLISPEDLARTAESVVIVDCRFRLDDPSWGRTQYLEAHIPGAVYAHLDSDLSGPKTGLNGRHPLPAPDVLASTFGRLGISGGGKVVAYDQDNGMFASRLWWLLRWLGHDAVMVVDGGFSRWVAEGRPTRPGEERHPSAAFAGAPRLEMTTSADEIEAVRSDPAWALVDARAPERYRGDIEPIDAVAGHIPGALNRPYLSNLRDDATFRPPGELRAEFKALSGNVASDHVICYCGSGVTACHNLLALEVAGAVGAKLYPGSWSEWIADPRRPVETSTG
jgi:thiosulfate/3-mercaptopyruvate sulfurtransferase